MDPSGSSSSIDWKRGWALRSGRFANLCHKCGSAYEKSIFCDVFHSKESGWRDCTLCGKHLHCGCIASKSLIELLEGGGVNCKNCPKSLEPHHIASDEKPDGPGSSKISELKLSPSDNKLDRDNVDEVKLKQLETNKDCNGLRNLLQSQNKETVGLLQKMKQTIGQSRKMSLLVLMLWPMLQSLETTWLT